MKPTLLLFLLFVSTIVYSQNILYKTSKRNSKFIKEISTLIKKKSLYARSLNWKQIAEELSKLPFENKDSLDHSLVLKFFIEKLKSVGDKHSLYLTQTDIRSFASASSEIKLPESEYLGSGIGFIKVPSCMTFNKVADKNFANSIRSQIKKLDTENEIIGWVVDLRNNNGGNMWPMVAGLNALMNDGTVGYLVGTENRKPQEWNVENGKINYSKEIVDTYKIKKINAKIAVLINSKTASSGEMTAITFIGLPNVKLFGQPSAGYTTANSSFYLSNGTQLFLATKFVADRTFKKYPDKIIPDVIINIQNRLPNDETLEYAKKWLLSTDEN